MLAGVVPTIKARRALLCSGRARQGAAPRAIVEEDLVSMFPHDPRPHPHQKCLGTIRQQSAHLLLRGDQPLPEDPCLRRRLGPLCLLLANNAFVGGLLMEGHQVWVVVDNVSG